jgi:hypothetical protein
LKDELEKRDKGNVPRGRIKTENSFTWSIISGQEIRLLTRHLFYKKVL